MIYLFFLFYFFFSIEIKSENTIEERILESNSLLEKSDFSNSQKILDELKKENPANPDLQLLQAEIWKRKASFHYDKKEFDKAKYYYNLLLSIWPNHPEILEKIKSANNELKNNKIPEKKEITEPTIKNDSILFGNTEIQINLPKAKDKISYEQLFFYIPSPKEENSLDIIFCNRFLLFGALGYVLLLHLLFLKKAL